MSPERRRSLALGSAALLVFGLVVAWPRGGRGASVLAGWLTHTGPHLLAAALLPLAAWGLGRPLLDRLLPQTLRADPASRALVAVALGLTVLQTLGVALSGLGLLPVGSGALVVGAFAALPALLAFLRALPPADERLRALSGASLVVSLTLLVPVLCVVGAPPTGPDELQYHLRLAAGLADGGGLAVDPEDPVSSFARGLHVLIALSSATGGSETARPLALLLGVLALLGGQRLARQLGGPLAGALALPLLLGAATVSRTLGTVSSDLPQGLFLTSALLLLLDEPTEGRPSDSVARRLIALGLLAGTAFSIKATAALFFLPVYLFAALPLLLRDPRPRSLLAAGAATLLPAVFAAPWLLANAVAGLHPLHPILGLSAPEGLEAAFRFNQTEQYGGGEGLRAWLRTPWDLFVLGREFDRRHFQGRLGPLPLFALPALLTLGRRRDRGVVAVVAATGLMLWAGPLRRVAYLLPLWPVLGAAAAAGLAGLSDALRLRGTAALLIVTLVAAVEVAEPASAALDDLPVAAGRVAPSDHLRARVASQPAMDWLARHVPADEAIATAFVWDRLPTGHRLLWACAEECPALRLRLFGLEDPRGARRELERLGVRWLLIRRTTFRRESYPHLTDAEFAGGYVRPLAILDGLISTQAHLRHAEGDLEIYELSPREIKPSP